MSQQKTSDDSSAGGRIHKRTLAVVFCLVVVPWILVAIPGQVSGGWGTTGSSAKDYQHGWPFVHLIRTEAIVDGTWVNKVFVPGQIPSRLELDRIARESAREHPQLKFDLRLERPAVLSQGDAWPTLVWKGGGFWSTPFQWTRPGTGRHWEFLWLGLVCNLLIVALVAVPVGWIIERRLRRQAGLFKFSLMSLLLLTALVAIATGWIVQEYSLYKKHERCLSNFESGSLKRWVYANENYKSRFPYVVFQLLNHGRLPWVDPRFFVALDDQNPGVLEVGVDEMKLGEIRELAEAVGDSPFSVNLTILDFGQNVERGLIEFGDLEVTELNIEFDLSNWVDSFSDHKDFSDDFLEDLKVSGERVNITASFPHLKRLSLHLDREMDEESQLKSFCDLPSLEEVRISGISQEGVNFILKTKEQWPRKVQFEFEQIVADKAKEELDQYFDSSFEFEE